MRGKIPFEEHMSPRAQQVFVLARREAVARHHEFVGTEHILLGILALEQGGAFDALRRCGVDFDLLKKEMESMIPVPGKFPLGEHIPYTPRVKTVMTCSAKEARTFKHPCIATEDLLLGLLAEGEGVAARALNRLGLTIERAREEITRTDFRPRR